MTRKDIMKNCPPEFVGELKDALDHLEDKVKDLVDYLDIKDVSGLHDIPQAFDIANQLLKDLY